MSKKILCLDIGSGTQDVLYYQNDVEIENCFKFVLPSPAKYVIKKINKHTNNAKDIYLSGCNMGGGFGGSVYEHIAAGCKVYSSESAAYSLGDDLEFLEKKGIKITNKKPTGTSLVNLSDFDSGWWDSFLSSVGLDFPDEVVACAQDHGFHPGKSNRMGRFELWEKFLKENHGDPAKLLFNEVPKEFTRLIDLQKSIGGGCVCDTGAAAVLGALYVDEIMEYSYRKGLCLVNIGNSHTVAFLIFKGRVYGVYEHHTGTLSGEKLMQDLSSFKCGKLLFEHVFDSYGHGCMTLDFPADGCDFSATYVLGPRRNMVEGYDVFFPAPGGDMMLAGSFGLLKGLELNGN